EHPITEVTTGLDLVKLQIFVASGGALEGECPPEWGHAVEARLNAEDADNDFAPAPGTVRLLKFPLGSGIRVDTGIAQGDVIPPDYDSMVAKIIAWGRDRNEAPAGSTAPALERRQAPRRRPTSRSSRPRSTHTKPKKAANAPPSWHRHVVADRAPATPSARRLSSTTRARPIASTSDRSVRTPTEWLAMAAGLSSRSNGSVNTRAD